MGLFIDLLAPFRISFEAAHEIDAVYPFSAVSLHFFGNVSKLGSFVQSLVSIDGVYGDFVQLYFPRAEGMDDESTLDRLNRDGVAIGGRVDCFYLLIFV